MIIHDEQQMEEQRFLHFTKYVRRYELARFLAQYEIFKRIIDVKGSIVECGVNMGAGVMAWAKLAETLEPFGFLRTVYGFDTFEGFPSVHEADLGGSAAAAEVGRMRPEFDVYSELQDCIRAFDQTRLIRHVDKVMLVKGDATLTIPEFLNRNPHLMVSLLYLDFDLYEPTKVALAHFLPRMPKGAIVAFDELNDPRWPGETQALLDHFELNRHRVECFAFEPHISFIVL
jgi:hypothetical protein